MSYQRFSKHSILKKHICVHKSDVALRKGVNKIVNDACINPYQCRIKNNYKRNQIHIEDKGNVINFIVIVIICNLKTTHFIL